MADLGGFVGRGGGEGRILCDLDCVPRQPPRVVRWLCERCRQVCPCPCRVVVRYAPVRVALSVGVASLPLFLALAISLVRTREIRATNT